MREDKTIPVQSILRDHSLSLAASFEDDLKHLSITEPSICKCKCLHPPLKSKPPKDNQMELFKLEMQQEAVWTLMALKGYQAFN